MDSVSAYEIGQEIGRGSFATVYKGKRKDTKTPVAIKSVLRSKLTRKLLESLESEISILKAIQHPNIVGLVDCVKSDSHIHLVMEYCSMGDLSNLIKKRKEIQGIEGRAGGLDERIVKHFLKQLASALQFLRSKNLIHRDIKPQNLLLTPNPAQQSESLDLEHLPVLKIADFGFARSLPAHTLADTLCGSPLYMAPEILRYEKYDAKADLWSVGAVLYELAVGKPPFRAQNHVDLLKRIEKCNDHIKFPGIDADKAKGHDSHISRLSSSPLNSEHRRVSLISEELMDLIRRLLKRNPNERMSFEEFFSHPYITGISRNLRNTGAGVESVPRHLTNNRHSGSFDALNTRHFSSDSGVRGSPYDTPAERIPRASSPRLIGPSRKSNDGMGDLKMDHYKVVESPNDDSGSPPSSLLIHPASTDSKPSAPRIHPRKVPHRSSSRDDKEAGDQYVPSNRVEDEILFEREYVVIEKRSVEVNALADELAASPRHASKITRNPPQPSPVVPIPLPYRKSDSAISQYQGMSNSPPIVFNKMEYNTTGANSGSVRDRSYSNPSGWASGATPSALARAISTASARLLGRTGQSPPYRELSFSKGGVPKYDSNTEADSVIKTVENAAYKAHAVLHLANLKFTELTPPRPEATKEIENLGTEEVSGKTGAEAFALYLKALAILQSGLDAAKAYWDNTTRDRSGIKSTSLRLNDAVQWMRDKFNESLEKADFVKLKVLHADETKVCVEKLMYDYALETSRLAAVNELVGEDVADCERSYQIAIWMLSALLDANEERSMDEEDRRTINKFIVSISNRLSALRRKINATSS
ncbi:Pkinase-domain-containing protein [Basidiobolus meristosporus CBS 931.73]|uniref:non-specific serine/threonine protein kinase n=1 Tax=Basidiobolus meristosporus CBS 931.73 TaxID=1314790 RepID=A0A1Y1YRT4_9FUNG|nr:Pkinase-domain-containing protein [Basidiobolus meristosporus CBS 931.73]|eukprot:ORY00275.1 Pkinase-domain-containing protein [Basidiobolus meristosporus CBS 931.73]